MFPIQPVSIPKKRSTARRLAGRQFYIAKRKLQWLYQWHLWAKQYNDTPLPHQVFTHSSLLLRPLKDADMQLQYNKITNLQLAVNHLNGLLIKPGETFSFWKLVGNPTASKGYKPGLTLQNGQVGQGIGGGLCQLGNLLYWMVLHSSLTITERWRHGYDVFPDLNRTLPFGSGATLSYNYIDLQFTNHTDRTYQLLLWLDDTHLQGTLQASEAEAHHFTVVETDHHIQHQWWGGYTRHNKIWQNKICKATGQESSKLVTQNHAIMMYEPLIGRGGIS